VGELLGWRPFDPLHLTNEFSKSEE